MESVLFLEIELVKNVGGYVYYLGIIFIYVWYG